MHQKAINTHDIESYLQGLGFSKNDWGFLSGKINDTEFILIKDPLFGYTLNYKYLSYRASGTDEISLGKKPTVEHLQTTIKKVQNAYKSQNY